MSTICQRHCAADFVSLFERKKDHDTYSESHRGHADRRRHRGWRLRRAAGARQWESLGERVWSAGCTRIHGGVRAGPQQLVSRTSAGPDVAREFGAAERTITWLWRDFAKRSNVSRRWGCELWTSGATRASMWTRRQAAFAWRS